MPGRSSNHLESFKWVISRGLAEAFRPETRAQPRGEICFFGLHANNRSLPLERVHNDKTS
jgi:hypothetical protein